MAVQLLALLVGLTCTSVLMSSVVDADPTGTRCPPVPGRSESCVCKTEKGVIDLTVFSNKDGTAKFTGLQDPNDFTYSYNPCQPYQGTYSCTTIHICQVSNYDPTLTYDIADAGTEEMWLDTDGTPYVYYTGPENRNTKVFLHCDESLSDPEITTEGDSGAIFNYIFDLHAKEICPKSSGGVAAGEIGIVIIFVIIPLGLITYFVVGAVIMKYKFNATGTDIVPNKSFWFSLPFLIKDGCLFTFSPVVGLIKGKVSGKQGYESVE